MLREVKYHRQVREREEGGGERWKLMTLGAKKNQVDADYLLITLQCTVINSVHCTLLIMYSVRFKYNE